MTHPTEPQLSTGTRHAVDTTPATAEELAAILAVTHRRNPRTADDLSARAHMSPLRAIIAIAALMGEGKLSDNERGFTMAAEIAAPRLGERLTPDAAAYAAELQAAGFTVYVEKSPRHPGTPSALSGWFHYSQVLGDPHAAQPILRDYYGTFQLGSYSFEPASHSMPIRPSRLNGSSAIICARWGDPATLGLDDMSPTSVEYARAVARPTNWAPYCTNEIGRQTGATMANSEPWGIGTHYVPAQVGRNCEMCGTSLGRWDDTMHTQCEQIADGKVQA